jgi:8-oxo-dGTP pyrophosphatase MutT (NUDIX family)
MSPPVAAGTGDFRLVSTAPIYDGAVFRLADETFESPTGETFRRQIVRHNGAVAVVPLHDDGTVTVISQFRASVMDRLLEIPAGMLDRPGEPLEEAARRELREEVGLLCGRLDHLCTYVPAPGMTDERVTIFVARDLTVVDTERHGPEEHDMVMRRVRLSDALAMIEAGEIIDGKTAYAFALLVAQGR